MAVAGVALFMAIGVGGVAIGVAGNPVSDVNGYGQEIVDQDESVGAAQPLTNKAGASAGQGGNVVQPVPSQARKATGKGLKGGGYEGEEEVLALEFARPAPVPPAAPPTQLVPAVAALPVAAAAAPAFSALPLLIPAAAGPLVAVLDNGGNVTQSASP